MAIYLIDVQTWLIGQPSFLCVWNVSWANPYRRVLQSEDMEVLESWKNRDGAVCPIMQPNLLSAC